MFNPDTLRERLVEIQAELRAIHTGAGDRALSTREQAQWDVLEDEQAQIRVALADHEEALEREARNAERRARWGGTAVAPGTRSDLGGEHRHGQWLAQYARANTVDTSTLTAVGRTPLPYQTLTDWWDLVRPQSKLLDSFPWRRITTDRAAVDIPHVSADGPATATNEGADITGNDGFDAESIVVTPAKFTSYEAISNEVWRDAQPQILDAYAQGITRRHALAWEAALVAALEATATTVATDANFATNLDVVSDAIVTMMAAGGQPSGIVTTAAVAQTLLKVKEVSGSTKPVLMDSGPADGFAGRVLGLPLVVSSAVTATKAVIFDASQAVLVVRQTPNVEVDTGSLFGTDSIAIRAVSRFAAKLMNAHGAYILTDSA